MDVRAVLLVDIQNDFLPGGALPVPRGDEIVPIANKLIAEAKLVVATLDWHPPDHLSFASNHPGRRPGDIVTVDGFEQVLWPVHCVQFTGGAFFAPGLMTGKIAKVFTKGEDPKVDSYSGFFDNGRRRATGLAAYLRERSVTELVVCGLATDYCVKATVLDALELGFRVIVVRPGCRAVNLKPEDEALAIEAMKEKGALIVESIPEVW